MTHSSINTFFYNIKNYFPTALIVVIISLAAIYPAAVMSENIKINGYSPEAQTEDTPDNDDCE